MQDTFVSDLLRGQVAFLTGGTSGIVLSIAKRFARAGARVAVVGRNAEKAAEAAREITESSPDKAPALGLSADVRDFAAISAAVKKATEELGPIDILVNGAAGNFPAPAAAMSANGFKAVVDIDLLGTFNASRAAFEHMRKPGARVVNISAGQAFMPAPLQAHVCAAKAGVDMVTRVLAMEWGPSGVRVNSLSPGPVDDTEGMKRLAPTAEIREKLTNTIPLRRYASREEIAEIALFLCSPAAAYVTGAVLVADGGHTLEGFGGMLR